MQNISIHNFNFTLSELSLVVYKVGQCELISDTEDHLWTIMKMKIIFIRQVFDEITFPPLVHFKYS